MIRVAFDFRLMCTEKIELKRKIHLIFSQFLDEDYATLT
jgi:hypothetical protein